MDADALYPRPGGPGGDDWIDRREEEGWRESPAARPAWDRSGVPEAVGMALVLDDDRRREAALEKLRAAVRAWRRIGRDNL
ncbi:hypothetical protein [Elioraea tepidiphila]|uniref:hypothetical protein n=1 Tax=Elioraea tepidiphila TaxID=457934 RepID=UPI002FDA9825